MSETAIPIGMHRHRCPNCLIVWEHEDSCVQLEVDSYKVAHKCPKCSEVVYMKFFGDAPDVVQRSCGTPLTTEPLTVEDYLLALLHGIDPVVPTKEQLGAMTFEQMMDYVITGKVPPLVNEINPSRDC